MALKEHDPQAEADLAAYKTKAPGSEIAYAEYTAGNLAVPTSGFVQIPGLSLAIPAGTGAYMLEFLGMYQIVASAGNGDGTVFTRLVDEGGVVLDQGSARAFISTSGKVWSGPISMKRRMLATAGAKTIIVDQWLSAVNATATMLNGPGNTTGAFGQGPVFVQAYLR